MFAFICEAQAAVKINNKTAERYEAQIIEESGDEAADIETLENDIRILDEEIAKCQKQKKGWIAATVVGAAGVVATGTAAIVQAGQLKDLKETRDEKEKELSDLQTERDKLKNDLNNAKKESK